MAAPLALELIRRLGVNGGIGFAYEYAGPVIARFSMEERMTLCNMSIEAGARAGLVAPDEVTFAWLEGRPHAPHDAVFHEAVERWRTLASDAEAKHDAELRLDVADLAPRVTWGTSPSQSGAA